MTIPRVTLSFIFILSLATLVLAAPGDGIWLTHVPAKERVRPNPFANHPEASTAGARLFQQHCAACHGNDASGRGSHPSLLTDRVRRATPGELHWLLTNGSLKNGMPSWSHLPDPQRWQIVTYLKSLPAGRSTTSRAPSPRP